MTDVIDRLRPRTVPSGYEFHTWTPGIHILLYGNYLVLFYYIGKSESFEDKLRSILAQFHYMYEIEKYEAQGIPFKTYMYVPEHHPETKNLFYEREDEAHLIKVCIATLYLCFYILCVANSKPHKEWWTNKT